MAKGEHSTKVKKHISYRASMVLSFVLIAVITAGLSVGLVAIVFGSYFSSYARTNMEAIASFAANRVAGEYDESKSFKKIDFIAMVETLQVPEETGIMVLDHDGTILYDSSKHLTTQDSSINYSPSAASQVAIADIISDGETIGSVRLWVYGSDVLMNRPDITFRDNTFEALIIAALVSVLIALIVGLIMAWIITKPINRITKTAALIAEGEWDARTNMKAGTEIDQLGEMFDNMAESVEKNRKLEMRLTSDVAHELRTPLMAIQATVEAMMDGVYEKDIEHLALVDSEVKRLSRLVDALLKLSRMEKRTQPLNEQVNDVDELVQEVVTTHKMLVEESGLTIDMHLEPDVKAFCDRDKIRQAVANLLSNAVRYTPEGGSINVYVRKDDEWAYIDVQDSGIGLSPEESKMVFSRFWRADSERVRDTGGLGVGLAMVKEIVSRHKGDVSVKSEKGKGSTFTIKIPRYDQERSKKQARAALKAFESKQR